MIWLLEICGEGIGSENHGFSGEGLWRLIGRERLNEYHVGVATGRAFGDMKISRFSILHWAILISMPELTRGENQLIIPTKPATPKSSSNIFEPKWDPIVFLWMQTEQKYSFSLDSKAKHYVLMLYVFFFLHTRNFATISLNYKSMI